jgi:hypothetical protein
MSEDIQAQPNPELKNDLVPPAPKMTSRRLFLQAATIAGAGAVTAGSLLYATHDATASRKLNHAMRRFTGITTPVLSKTIDPISMCIEDSSFNIESTFSVSANNGKGTIFLWFTAHSLPVDTYTLSFTLDGSPFDPTTTSAPFKLSDNGNNVYVYQVTNPTTLPDCPGASSVNAKNNGTAYDNLDLVPSPAFTNSASGTTIDAQIMIHLKWNGGTSGLPHTYLFGCTITATGSNSISTTVPLTVSA